ncbi:hypothetical protein [Kribbella italica]|uniref:Uncharacterized protein n=1 Tax=Kribbella italica TaxID=1540520 RepID=A0A7W9MYH8_9ACTN|nr:hypothetical protein [Kribbella italica]MBB5840435.1 hypothetical protein [Kribbella italica]
MRRFVVITLAAVAVAALAVGGKVVLGEEDAAIGLEPRTVPLPEGWRWEAYRNVQLQVPVGWGQSQWAGLKTPCGLDQVEQKPIVRRPGGAVLAMLEPCLDPTAPQRHVAPSVAFTGDRPGVVTYADGWIKETRRLGEQLITVTSADGALRARIFAAAAVVIDADGNGCDPVAATARNEILRPAAQGGLTTVGDVQSVSVCRYEGVRGPAPRSGGAPYDLAMEASSRLTGPVAQRLVRDLVAAPAGTGPTVTDQRVCFDDPGGEIIVLRVDGSVHDQDVVYRYAGCKHNGTDDGTTLRRATSATAKAIFVGVHAPDGVRNVLHQLLYGPPGPVL